jgi:hypothetical protein
VDIGKPQRIYTIEPVEDPVPRREPLKAPAPPPLPKKDPAPSP